MTWALVHDGAVRATGSYHQMLGTADDWMVCERTWHLDGTENAPKLVRGWMIVPAAMVARTMRRAA